MDDKKELGNAVITLDARIKKDLRELMRPYEKWNGLMLRATKALKKIDELEEEGTLYDEQ